MLLTELEADVELALSVKKFLLGGKTSVDGEIEILEKRETLLWRES